MLWGALVLQMLRWWGQLLKKNWLFHVRFQLHCKKQMRGLNLKELFLFDFIQSYEIIFLSWIKSVYLGVSKRSNKTKHFYSLFLEHQQQCFLPVSSAPTADRTLSSAVNQTIPWQHFWDDFLVRCSYRTYRSLDVTRLPVYCLF